jgi:hypothetical protein
MEPMQCLHIWISCKNKKKSSEKKVSSAGGVVKGKQLDGLKKRKTREKLTTLQA